MPGNLKRRLERLLERHPSAAGRKILLKIEADRVDDKELARTTLASSSVERGENDLLVLIKRFTVAVGDTGCALLSVSPISPKARRTLG